MHMMKNTPTVKIIVATHKKYEMPKDKMYLPIHVGAEGKRNRLAETGIDCEPIRVDDYTGKKMTFFHDPDGLPLELHE